MNRHLCRVAWGADWHLDFLDAKRRCEFYAKIVSSGADAVIISGDISNGRYLGQHLAELADATHLPIWFVLGNHDFYMSGVDQIRKTASDLCDQHFLLHWLPKTGVVPLSETVGLIGVDSWADGRAGAYWESTVELNDHRLIADMIALCASDRLKVMQRIADEAEVRLRELLAAALSRFQTVLIASHVPMFYEACLDPSTRPSGDMWLPHFTWHAGGTAIMDVLQSYPNGRVLALCGHTHTRASIQISKQITVCVAGAEYDRPKIEAVLDLDNLNVQYWRRTGGAL
jgi:hypothetical protein